MDAVNNKAGIPEEYDWFMAGYTPAEGQQQVRKQISEAKARIEKSYHKVKL